jgi:hypothetical protein|tara:strand:+ start:11583 stop:11912 length:330 start_codon:yes stop_codon:yes gene_type:complete
MEGLLNFIYPALAILQLIGVICFFVMCYNVSCIKRQLGTRTPEFFNEEYKKHLLFNDIPSAQEALKEFMYLKLKNVEKAASSERDSYYIMLKDKYKHMFDKVNMEFPKL